MKNLKLKVRFTFRYISENLYEILDNNAVTLCIRAHGLSALVIEKHRTAMVSKQTTAYDRFDKIAAEVLSGWAYEAYWVVKSGPKVDEVNIELNKVLDQIVEHHINYIAKLIVE